MHTGVQAAEAPLLLQWIMMMINRYCQAGCYCCFLTWWQLVCKLPVFHKVPQAPEPIK